MWDVDPIIVTKNQPVGLVWLSPDCKHFSKAKGGKPVEKEIRGLAWIGVRWVVRTKPRGFMLENVEEFQTWGPLLTDADGHSYPDPTKKGQTFRVFRQMLTTGVPLDERDGNESIEDARAALCTGPLAFSDAEFAQALDGLRYTVECSELKACDYGTPTIRKRFFMVGRRDGLPTIARPPVTHAAPTAKEVKAGKLKPWRTAAECIDWSIPCPSIFERKKPLADATLRRIAKGVMRYVVESGDPFIVPLTHQGGDRIEDVAEPMRTVTGAHRGERAIVVPTLVQTGYGEREGQAPRALDIEKPLGTAVGGAVKHALVSAFLAKHYTGVVGSDLKDSMGTVTAVDHHSLVSAALVGVGARAGQSRPRSIEEPTATTTAKYDTALVAAHLVHYHADKQPGDVRASEMREPVKTQTTENRHALVTSHLMVNTTGHSGAAADEPVPTITTGGHHAEVRAFLLSYYSTDQDPKIGGPLPTATTKDRFGLVTIHGQDYQIVDIGLRMLTPRELFKAQGFPDDYVIGDDETQGLKLTKSAQVRMCGNSVCPPLAEALVRANFGHEAQVYERQVA
ncbi:MAG TPA: DNA cytosine methyltransferase [Variovorax sp.]